MMSLGGTHHATERLRRGLGGAPASRAPALGSGPVVERGVPAARVRAELGDALAGFSGRGREGGAASALLTRSSGQAECARSAPPGRVVAPRRAGARLCD